MPFNAGQICHALVRENKNYNNSNQFKMYGKLPQRKITQTDYLMSCEQVRQELNDYLNDEAKRVNIDSAKKRAVVQHMDYEGFRQMVLGANIFPTKSKELYNFSKGQTAVMSGILEGGPKDEPTPVKKTEQEIEIERVKGKSEMHCNSFREFKKKFNEQYSKEFDNTKTLYCYNLLKQQNENRIRKIFNTECEGNILVKIANVFMHVLSQMSENKTQGVEKQANYILLFFKILMSIPTMQPVTLQILSRRQKESVAILVKQLGRYLPEQAQGSISCICLAIIN